MNGVDFSYLEYVTDCVESFVVAECSIPLRRTAAKKSVGWSEG